MTEVPQSFDRFEALRVLGKGGMGTVYLARDPRLDRPVALKVLHAEDVGTDERRARFLREARTAAAIRHPNVATIYEVGETGEGVPFIVMEYCEGETLGPAQLPYSDPPGFGGFSGHCRGHRGPGA